MPAYKLAADSLDNLAETAERALREVRATAAYLEAMDPARRLTQDALLHNAYAEGATTSVLRQAANLRELVRLANGGRPRRQEDARG
jgi:hypothetical protein